MLAKPVNIGLADDHALFRKMLRSFLSEQKNIHVNLQASTIFELLDKLKSTPIDVLLMDVFLPEINALNVLKTLHEEYPHIKILVLSMSRDMELISSLMDAGIQGYISKSDEPEDLLYAIMSVAENKIYRNKFFTEALYWNKQNDAKPHVKREDIVLNEREKKILQLIWEEKSNKDIADELYLGVRSVEKIRQDLKEKIGVKSTIGLVKYAIDKRIIAIGLSPVR